MRLYHRLFAAYYFLFLKSRKISKSRIEAEQAVTMLCAVHISLLISVLVVFQKLEIIHPLKQVDPGWIVLWLLFALLSLFFAHRYFLKSREKRNRIIDAFRSLSPLQKGLWNAVAIVLVMSPLLFILIAALL